MDLNILAKTFAFTRDDGLTYDSTAVAIAFAASLKPGATSGAVTTKASTPMAARQLIGFQAIGVGLEALRYQLYDGTTLYFYDTVAHVWTATTDPTKFNTETELAAHVPSFPLLPARAFGVRVFLAVGSALTAVKFAYSVGRLYSYIEDLVYRSLVRDLKAKYLPVLDAVHKVAAPSTQIDVAGVVKETLLPLTLISVDAAFDRTADPNLLTDLFVSYNADTQVATLASSIPAGHTIQLALVYQPDIVVEATSPDFQQVEKVPALIISNIEEIDSSPMPSGEWVVNKSDQSAIIIKAPYRGTLRFTLTVMAPGGTDLHRMVEAVKTYAVQNPILYSHAIDEGYRLFLRDEFVSTTEPTAQGIHSATARFDVMNVLMWKEKSAVVPNMLIRRVVANVSRQ